MASGLLVIEALGVDGKVVGIKAPFVAAEVENCQRAPSLGLGDGE
jgi:hypothetical protein